LGYGILSIGIYNLDLTIRDGDAELYLELYSDTDGELSSGKHF